ncbi:SGNH/GDSL hydrolase family protein [Jiulongibacter sediminis]|uniref:SGNH hydrolase-type esterase domain-containing protein n=1 Tax=Jiulongibacter sediminis TaxID=1605367 RepID=A0A0P7C0C6_9BACT|nr:SGNH/GDSL hydrolase family protein [Jiulongibacter sediminis]KPM47435.1 hypothetical protein AFM12_14625 [Jiulongibacter sediminis]TBX23014.1 hypothetical protein TK44_14635 [Jiulongibacter sediminis]
MIRLLCFLVLISCSRLEQLLPPEAAGSDSTISVLLVGNSLTYTNNLPELIKKEALLFGVEIRTEMLALPNYAIPDHLSDGKLQRLIKKGDFDFVVAQQGPSSQADGRQMLLDTAPVLDELCKKHGARLAYFMVWPSRQYYQTFDGVITNYTAAAKSVNAILCPVGVQWKEVTDTGDFSYYGLDGFHPSQKGSELAAKIIWESIHPNN